MPSLEPNPNRCPPATCLIHVKHTQSLISLRTPLSTSRGFATEIAKFALAKDAIHVIAARYFFNECPALWAILPTLFLFQFVHTFVSDILTQLSWMMRMPTSFGEAASKGIATITNPDSFSIFPRNTIAIGIIKTPYTCGVFVKSGVQHQHLQLRHFI